MVNPFDPTHFPSPFDPAFEHHMRELGPQIERMVRDLDPTALYTLMRYATTALPTGSPVRARILGLLSEEQRTMYLNVYDQMRAEGRADGKLEGKLEALLKLLAHRGLARDEPFHSRALACTNEAQLERWFDRALVATTLADVFAEP